MNSEFFNEIQPAFIDQESLRQKVLAALKTEEEAVKTLHPYIVKSTGFPVEQGEFFRIPFWRRMVGFDNLVEGIEAREFTDEHGTGELAVGAYEYAGTIDELNPALDEMATRLARLVWEYLHKKSLAAAGKTPNKIGSAMFLDLFAASQNNPKDFPETWFVMHSFKFKQLLDKTGLLVGDNEDRTINFHQLAISDLVCGSKAPYYASYLLRKGSVGLYYDLDNVKTVIGRHKGEGNLILMAELPFAAHLFGLDEKSNSFVAENVGDIEVYKLEEKFY